MSVLPTERQESSSAGSRAASLSVVVCTHDRAPYLARCLEGLAEQNRPAEVVVVDSASTPPVDALVARFRDRIPELVYVREDRPGLSLARNRGVEESTGELVAFVDDDAVPAPHWAAEIVAAFADPRVGCAGGECVARFEAPRPPWLSDRLLRMATVTDFGPDARRSRSRAEWPVGANVCFRRQALASAGRFDERLGRVGKSLLAYEDMAMLEAIDDAGWEIWLRPSAVVEHTVHAERCESRFYWRREWWNGVSRARRQASIGVALRKLVGVPAYLALYLLTRDRYFLYFVAESGGYASARARHWVALARGRGELAA